MKALVLNLLTIVTLAFASNAQASGFQCRDIDDLGYNVKLYNHTSGGTRVPAKLIVSQEDQVPATLLVRSTDEISKTNRANTVRYTVAGNRKIGADTVILQISFKEGSEVLEAGEEVPGQLILADDMGDREVVRLVCARYLKGE